MTSRDDSPSDSPKADGPPIDGLEPTSKDFFEFGPFRLSPTRRTLERDGVAQDIGSRTLDILIALVERAGQVVSKKDLLARVWQGCIVEDGSLRFQVSELRRALDERGSGTRYVDNVSGRGYCFVAPLRETSPSTSAGSAAQRTLPAVLSHNPPRLTTLIGRDEDRRAVLTKIASEHFVSIVGAGGIGKTTLAAALAQDWQAATNGTVYFVDIGAVVDATLVSSAVAASIGLTVPSSDPVPGLICHLQSRDCLLVLDGCEHVVREASALTQRIHRQAPNVGILSTTREPLRAAGEHVYRLQALGCPPEADTLSGQEALAFPAVRLFIERLGHNSGRRQFSDSDMQAVSEICRRLDGIALAIELAASRACSYGVPEVRRQLRTQIPLVWRGHRDALPRHETLSAALEWSYRLLSTDEQTVLRRLSVFSDAFGLEAACAVAQDESLDIGVCTQAVEDLVEKSLIFETFDGHSSRFRLLDTTKSYLQLKTGSSEERRATDWKHAAYCRAELRSIASRVPSLTKVAVRSAYMAALADTRGALEWSFSSRGDRATATRLAAASTSLFLGLSLLEECRAWSSRGVELLDESAQGTHEELELQSALGFSLMFTTGNNDDACVTLTRALELAGNLGERYTQLRLLGALSVFQYRIGNFSPAVELTHRAKELALQMHDASAIAAVDWMLCISYHLFGGQAEAQKYCESALARPAPTSMMSFGREYRVRASCAWARTLWLRGFADQAREVANNAIDEAEQLGNTVHLCVTLVYAGSVFLWTGDWQQAEPVIDRLLALSERHSLAAYHFDGLAMRGELLLGRGDADGARKLLQARVDAPAESRSEILSTVYATSLAESLAAVGELDKASALIDETLVRMERIGDWFYKPEAARVRAVIDQQAPQSTASHVEWQYLCSIELARKQAALAWELRSATCLARLWCEQSRPQEAHALVGGVYERLTEGFDTRDALAARELLEELASNAKSRSSAALSDQK